MRRQSSKHPQLGSQNARSPYRLNLLLGNLREKLCLDNDGLLGEGTLPENLEVTSVGKVEHWGDILLVFVL